MDWIRSLAFFFFLTNLPEGLFLSEYKVFRGGTASYYVFMQYLFMLPYIS